MRFKYEKMQDTIARKVREEEKRTGRKVIEVLLEPKEWVDFKSEMAPYQNYDSFKVWTWAEATGTLFTGPSELDPFSISTVTVRLDR